MYPINDTHFAIIYNGEARQALAIVSESLEVTKITEMDAIRKPCYQGNKIYFL